MTKNGQMFIGSLTQKYPVYVNVGYPPRHLNMVVGVNKEASLHFAIFFEGWGVNN